MSTPTQALEATEATEATDVLDGLHHAWCKRCHPQWAQRALGAELAVPFVAWCGQLAVILTVWQDDGLPPGLLCSQCWAAPVAPCATCGTES